MWLYRSLGVPLGATRRLVVTQLRHSRDRCFDIFDASPLSGDIETTCGRDCVSKLAVPDSLTYIRDPLTAPGPPRYGRLPENPSIEGQVRVRRRRATRQLHRRRPERSQYVLLFPD